MALQVHRPHLLLLLFSHGCLLSLRGRCYSLTEGGSFLINVGVLLLQRGESPVEIMPPLGGQIPCTCCCRVRLRAGGATAVQVPVSEAIWKLLLLALLAGAIPNGQGHIYPKGRPARFCLAALPFRSQNVPEDRGQADHSQRVSYKSSGVPFLSPAIIPTSTVILGVSLAVSESW